MAKARSDGIARATDNLLDSHGGIVESSGKIVREQSGVSYFSEFRTHWRPLLAAAIGSASGLMVAAYTTSIFSPYLMTQFHWSRAQFSVIGVTIFAALLVTPFVGRLTDRFGVRPMALVGALGLPLCFIGYSLQDGRFGFFVACSTAVLIVGSATTPAVWCRPVAENFKRARGLALFLVTGAPALVGAVLPHVLIAINDAWGWRIGYRVLAAWFLLGGLLAIALLPKREPGLDRAVAQGHARARVPGAYRLILRSPAAWIITLAMMLCVLPTQLHAAQMMVMLNEAGLDRFAGAKAFSAFAVGSIIGRGACGLALDRFDARWVAMLSMLLPALGYVLITMNHGAIPVVVFAMLLVGLSYGAESDLPSFLVARHFRIEVFSSAMSVVYCGVLFASASGAMILALVLRRTNSFTPFLLAAAAAIVVGSMAFLALPGRGVEENGDG